MVNNLQLVKFIKISNNNHSSQDFMIDCTTMFDTRIRISSFKTAYKHYLAGETGWKPIYHYFQRDYSFYTIYKGRFNNYAEIKEQQNTLYYQEWKRMNRDNMDGFHAFINDRM